MDAMGQLTKRSSAVGAATACASVLTVALMGAAPRAPAPRPAMLPVALLHQPQDQPPTTPSDLDELDKLEPECVVELSDGRRIEGRLVEQTDSIVRVRINTIVSTFKTDDIDRVRVLEPVRIRYERMRRAAGDTNIEQLLMLNDWLVEHHRFRLALTEIEHVLRLDPSNARALARQRYLQQQIKLLDHARPDGAAPRRDRPDEPERFHFPLLTANQINLIRVFEVDLANPPRMLIERATVDKLIERYAGTDLIPTTREGRRSLYRKRPEQILELMFRLRARELYGEVKVLEDPPALRLFRDEVHRKWLIPRCATNDCHGGQDAGRLWLANERSNAPAVVYTNFLILERFRMDDGRPLIDYDEPAKSPLLQLALPTDLSKVPHPVVSELGRVKPWRPALKTTDDPRFIQAVKWIRSMYRPRPEHGYPVDYDPPVPAGAKALPEDSPPNPPR